MLHTFMLNAILQDLQQKEKKTLTSPSDVMTLLSEQPSYCTSGNFVIVSGVTKNMH